MLSRLQSRLAALRGLRADMAALGLGALAAAALPPFHVIPVLLVSVPGLLVLLDAAPFSRGGGAARLVVRPRPPRARALLDHRGDPVRGGALLVAGAACRARAGGGARGVHRRRLRWRRVGAAAAGRASLALAGAWVLADLARQFVLTGFPWNPWGSVWEIPGPSATCSSSPPPGSACTGSPWRRCCSRPCRRSAGAGAPAGAALLAAWAAFGLVRLAADRAADAA